MSTGVFRRRFRPPPRRWLPPTKWDGWTTFADGTSATTGATVTGLTNGVAYEFRVAAVNSVGQGAWSNVAGPYTPAAGVNNGAATGSIAWVGTATGIRTSSSSATGSIAWAGSATGARTSAGAATGAITWAGPAVVSSSNKQAGTDISTAANAVLPPGATAGDLVLYFVSQDTDANISASTGWTTIISREIAAVHEAALFGRVLDGTTGDNILNVDGGVLGDYTIIGARITNHPYTTSSDLTTIQVSSALGGAVGQSNPPNLTGLASSRHYRVLAYGVIDTTSTEAIQGFTADPAGYELVQSASSADAAGSTRGRLAQAVLSGATSVNPGAFTSSVDRPWIAFTVAIPESVVAATGARSSAGAATGAITWAGSATGARTSSAAATGSITWAGSATSNNLAPLNGTYQWASTAYTQDALTTFGTLQYAIWVDDQRHARIAKRTHGGRWENNVDLFGVTATGPGAASLSGYVVGEDSHRTVVVAVDSDGFIHASGGMHSGALRYMRTTNAGDLSAWTKPSMVGTDEATVTYPTFVKCLDGTLLFAYRNGSSGDGDWFLNTYNTTTQTWSRVAKWLDGVTDSLSAYPQRIALDTGTGRLHAMWMWRDTGLPSSNEDVCYGYSDDNGVTWKHMDGTAYTLPIRKSTSDIALDTTTPGTLLNNGGLAVDLNGHPHASFLAGTPRQIHHLYWNGSAWVDDIVSAFTGTYVVSRPAAVAFDSGRLWLLFTTNANGRGNELRAIDVTNPSSPVERLIYNDDLLEYEPSFDTEALYARNELHMLIAQMRDAGAEGGDPADLAAQMDAFVLEVEDANVGTSSGAIAWAGSATGARTSSGAATGDVTWAGSATGTRTSSGAATGDVTWAGSATGTRTSSGAASGDVAWAGSATGETVSAGSATGAIAWAGSATGEAPVVGGSSGSASGSISWAGSATGEAPNAGAATGSIAWAGSATGETTNTGAASGSIAWDGTATGETTAAGAVTGSIAWVGTATGSSARSGAATGSIAWAGSATGESASQGSASGAIAWAGSATGEAPIVGGASGSADGDIAWAGSATGARTSSGSASGSITWVGVATGANIGIATGSISWAGSATGETTSEGATTGAISWAGSATGEAPAVGVNQGSATGSITWAGSATGSATRSGAASGSITWAGSATGATVNDGTATGSVTWAGTATGEAPIVAASEGSATGAVTWAGAATGTITTTGDASGSITWVGSAIAAIVFTPTPGERILVVKAEDRTLIIPAEVRTLIIPAEVRTLTPSR